MSRGAETTRSGLGILEEALRCLRREPALLAPYYLGTLPFVLGFLHFWSELSRSAAADQRCVSLSLALALLFVWMKLWHAVFAEAIVARRVGRSPPRLSARRATSLLAVQTPIQATGFLILPAAALLMFPFGWACAFYQHAAAVGPGPGGLRAAAERAWRHAARAPLQNHVLLLILSVLGYFALLNVAMGLGFLPFLLKGLFGVESPFTRNPWAFTSTPFLATVASLTYLCVDPIAKAAYALRHFYGESEASGTDLLADLRAGSRADPTGPQPETPAPGRPVHRTRVPIHLLLTVVALAGGLPHPARAETSPPPAPEIQRSGVPAGELDAAMDRVLARPEYAWRLPSKSEPEVEDKGWLTRFWDGAWELLSAAGDTVVEALRTVLGWLAGLLPRSKPGDQAPGLWKAQWLKGLLFAVLAIVLGVFAFLLARRRAKRSKPEPTALATPAPDLEDDDVAADALPPEGWEELARDLIRKGETRSGLRALFLGILARLARDRLLTVARYKSNRDYAEELARRTGSGSGVFAAFAENVRLFEQVWYGTHAATQELLARFQDNGGKVLAHGQ